MLRELKVSQFALIEELSVVFRPGFNVLTGETGAGKSLLIDALGLAVGGRACTDWIRAGAEEAVVEALFEPETGEEKKRLDMELEKRGLPSGEGLMAVRRIIDSKGRNRVYINGSISAAGILSGISATMVAICGQHEHVSLSRAGESLDLVDSFAGASSGGFIQARQEYHGAWKALESAREAMKAFEEKAPDRAERESYLRFRISEIESLNPQPGEMEELEARRKKLRGTGILLEKISFAESWLYSDDDSVTGRLARIQRAIDECLVHDPDLAIHTENISTAVSILTDTAYGLTDYLHRLEDDPRELEQVENRLFALRKLARRYGGNIAEASADLENLSKELEILEGFEKNMEECMNRLENARNEARNKAIVLSGFRRQAADKMEKKVRKSLDALGMKTNRMAVRIHETGLSFSGCDRVDIGLAGEPGAPLKPVSRVASGGELSRLLLAFRSAISEVDGVSTCVFDEVDAGVGGSVAEATGNLLSKVAGGRQVLCVTHLPQIAVQAEYHLVVGKNTGKNRPVITVKQVVNDDRVEEIARMLGGARITDSTRIHAAEMLKITK